MGKGEILMFVARSKVEKWEARTGRGKSRIGSTTKNEGVKKGKERGRIGREE